MGVLVPEDLPLGRLPRSERRVVRALESGLLDSWLIIPRLDMTTERRPYELDVLLINENRGMLGIEVKGGRFEIRDGEWYRDGRVVAPPPPRQAQSAAYELRDLLKSLSESLRHIHVEHAVALPDLVGFSGNLPLGVVREQLLFSGDLAEPRDPVWNVMCRDVHNRPLDQQQMQMVIDAVRPKARFVWNPATEARLARRTLQRISGEQIRALATLDQNQQVVVSGPPGSGKTRLALAWAERAVHRGERTLLTCYNEPIADWLGESAPENDLLTVGPLQRTLFALAGLGPLEPPADADSHWWDTEPFRVFADGSDRVTDLFDTIIVDEAQDFSPDWFDVLDGLFRDDGPHRMLILTDPGQTIYDRGFALPVAGPHLVRADLTVNCRNTHLIADLLLPLGGAPTAPGGPEGEPVRFVNASSDKQIVDAVGDRLEELVVTEGIDPANVLVITGHRLLRDQIRDASPNGFACAAWEARHGGDIVCETIHRSKGLERDAVILATADARLGDDLLYVGLSRAVSKLTVVGPAGLTKRVKAMATS